MVYVFRRISQDVLLPYLQATTCRARARNLLQTILRNSSGDPNTNIVCNITRLPNLSANY